VSTPPHPLVRSFKPRRRKLGAQTALAYDRLSPQWCLGVDGPMLDLAAVFDHHLTDSATVVLDIGFGYGDALLEVARQRPQEWVIGIDVHTPGVARVLSDIETYSLTNIRLVNGDVMEFLPRVPMQSLHGVRIYFPDPWTKIRHHHRRIVRPGVIDDLIDRMHVGGELHMATDIADYGEQMLAVCGANSRLEGGQVERSGRPVTSFERRGLAAGRHPVDVVYRRVR
jgi:tRNA (guanine-N7-)-methyltransferase